MRVVAEVLARWNRLSRALRAVTAAASLAFVALCVSAGLLWHPPGLALFPAPLHPDQLAEVEERLAGWGVAFTPTGDNVVVAASRRNDLLLRLSLAGVPHPHLGSTGEALASVGVLTPQSVVDAQARAGLAGDIEAGLRGIEGVDDARVIVAPAKASEFADEAAHAAGASVRLRLQSGAVLSREAIAGIRAFVAASVPELEAKHVTVLDDRGVALGESTGGDDAAGLQRSLQSALDAAFGEAATIVRVRAQYSGQETSERDLRRVPVGADAIERTARSESYDASGKRYRHMEEGEARGSDTHEVVSQQPPGALERLSTAVFVDAGRALDVAKVRRLAAAAVGYDPSRGDALAVEAVSFARKPATRRSVWWLLYGAAVPLAPAVVLALALVLSVRLALPRLASVAETFVERAAIDRASQAAAGFAPARVRSLLEQEPPHAAAAIISALPAATATAVLELYPPHEREAIVERMQRRHSPLVDDARELLRRRA